MNDSCNFTRCTVLYIFLSQKERGYFYKKKSTAIAVLFFLEVPARFELADQSFADSCLTTWLRYHL